MRNQIICRGYRPGYLLSLIALTVMLAASVAADDKKELQIKESIKRPPALGQVVVTDDDDHGTRYRGIHRRSPIKESVRARSVIPTRRSVIPRERHYLPRFDANIWTTRRSYSVGDSIDVGFRVSQDAWVYIFNTDARGITRQIFPNYYDRDNSVRGNRTYRIPDRGYDLTVIGPSGYESLEIVAVSTRHSCLSPWERFSRSDPWPRRRGASELILRLKAEIGDHDYDTRYEGRRVYGDVTIRGGNWNGQVVVGPPRVPTRSVRTATDETRFRVLGHHGPGDWRWRDRDDRDDWRDRDDRDDWRDRDDDDYGELDVSSSPSGAEVFIDGEYVGRTPEEIELPEGRYEITVRKRGYEKERERVRIKEDDTKRIHFRLKRD